MQRQDERAFAPLVRVWTPLMSYHHDEFDDATYLHALTERKKDTDQLQRRIFSVCPSSDSDGKYSFDPMKKKYLRDEKKHTALFVQFGMGTAE